MSLEMIKSIVTTIAVVLALVQALEMMQIRGYVRLLPFDKQVLRRFHRVGGITTMVLILIIAVICVIGEGYVLYTLRVGVHVALGVLSLLIMVAKVTITHRFRHYLRFNTGLGIAGGVTILGTFVTSALWYFTTGYMQYKDQNEGARWTQKSAAGFTYRSFTREGLKEDRYSHFNAGIEHG